MAAECCRFLHGVDVKSERWDPYHDWAGQMGKEDTIVTFNYDRVIEKLNANYIEVVVPGVPPPDGARTAHLLKLHGSVDWRRDGTRNPVTFAETKDEIFALTCTDDELAIATPGPAKRTAAGELRELWKRAEKALVEADAVVFIGYRFPPSDAEARGRLLRAIGQNKSGNLWVHIVLGDDAPAANRLKHLVEFAIRRGATTPPVYKILVHPLYSQDFLTVWSPGILHA